MAVILMYIISEMMGNEYIRVTKLGLEFICRVYPEVFGAAAKVMLTHIQLKAIEIGYEFFKLTEVIKGQRVKKRVEVALYLLCFGVISGVKSSVRSSSSGRSLARLSSGVFFIS